jgi:hypothetical protein
MKKLMPIVVLFCITNILSAQKITIADKTPIKMQAITSINSASVHLKDSFSVSLFEDITVEGKVVFTKGTIALATIDAIEPAKTNGRPAKVNILYAIQAPDGTKIYCKSENKGQATNFAKKSGNIFATSSYASIGIGLATGIIKGKDENGLSIFIAGIMVGGMFGIAGLLTTPLRLIKGGEVKINAGEIIETTVDRDVSFQTSASIKY